jgi:hypothetical protein
MIKHIVFWKLKAMANGSNKAANALFLKDKLEALRGKIPGLIKLEVGLDISNSDASSDVCLYSEFESKAALDAYQDHPLHARVKDFVAGIREERRIVDYEME